MKTRHNKIFIALQAALLVPVGLAMMTGTAEAAPKNSVTSGNWATSGTWSPAALPTTTDDIIINNGNNVSILGSATGRVAKTVTTNNTGTLTLTASNSTLTIGSGAGSLTNNGTVSMLNGVINGGVTTSGTFTQTAGTINSFTPTLGAFTVAGGTTNINGGTLNTGNLTVSGGTATLNGGLVNADTIDANGGSLVNNSGFLSVSNLNLAGGAVTLTNATDNVYVGASYSNTGFGTGNSFDASAGITGAGKVLAAGDTGDGGKTNDGASRLSIGGTDVPIQADATSGILTFANKHVGDTAQTFNYTIQNIYSSDSPNNATLSGPETVNAIQYSGTGLTGAGATPGNHTLANGVETGSLAVTRSTSTAGTVAGQTIVVKDNFGDAQTINVAGGGVYTVTSSEVATTAVVADQHVGGTNTTGISVKNNGPTGAFTENVSASVVSASGTSAATGSIGSLAAQATNNTSILASVNTANAGAQGGTVVINTQSVAGGTGLSNTNLGNYNVAVSGNVYAEASTTGIASPGNLGGFHVGDTAITTVNVKNDTAASGGFTESLIANKTGTSGDALGSATSGAIGANSTGTVTVGIDTTSAGGKTGSVAYQLTSVHVAGSTLADTNLSTSNVGVSATVYSYADAALKLNTTDSLHPSTAGVSLAPNGTSALTYTLNLGNQLLGAGGGTITGALNMLNLGTAGFSDFIQHATLSGFTNTGSISLNTSNLGGDFGNIVGGGQSILRWVEAASTAVGTISGSFQFKWNGANEALNYVGENEFITVNYTGSVSDNPPPSVPEPGMLWLFGSAGIAWFATKKKKAEIA